MYFVTAVNKVISNTVVYFPGLLRYRQSFCSWHQVVKPSSCHLCPGLLLSNVNENMMEKVAFWQDKTRVHRQEAQKYHKCQRWGTETRNNSSRSVSEQVSSCLPTHVLQIAPERSPVRARRGVQVLHRLQRTKMIHYWQTKINACHYRGSFFFLLQWNTRGGGGLYVQWC